MTGSSDRAVWRLSVPPTTGPLLAEAIGALLPDAIHYFDWAGGLVWLALKDEGDAGAAIIRAAIESTPSARNGHATLVRASETVRSSVAVYQPQARTLAALTKRIKESFDPKHILNPGRMYEGV